MSSLDKIRPYVHFIIYGGILLAALGAGAFLPNTTDILDLNENIKYVYAIGGVISIALFAKFYGPLKPRDKFVKPVRSLISVGIAPDKLFHCKLI